jgi:hypothetical protein
MARKLRSVDKDFGHKCSIDDFVAMCWGDGDVFWPKMIDHFSRLAG